MPDSPSRFERLVRGLIRLARRLFRNTWLARLPITTYVYRRMFHSLYSDEDKEVRFRGHRLVVPMRDVTIAPSLIDGEYETFELDIFERIVQPGMVVFDVGANLGIYSVIAAARVGSAGRVFAFEPVPENLEYLRTNIELNGLRNVEVVPQGVGSEKGQMRIFLSPNGVGSHSAAAANVGRTLSGQRSTRGHVDVPVITIDEFAAARSVVPDVVKMDIEGYEAFAVRGAATTLERRPTLLMEFSAPLLERCGSDPIALAQLLMQIYGGSYLFDERARRLRKVERPEDLRGLWNGNLLFTTDAGRFV
ncbi:MAG TPA: FkbM family methyltransferase [Actinomycetota bacterium]|nr:FkbM family methyltransferase [Actinomycetota bacterium]